MADFKVVYEQNISAETHEDAAAEAYDMMLDAEAFPPILTVTKVVNGHARDIDMELLLKER